MVRSSDSHDGHQTRRLLIVALLICVSLLMWAPDLRRLAGHPLGVVQLSFNYGGVVTAVGPSAIPSGIRPGDRMDLTRATLEQRKPFGGAAASDAGVVLTLPMLRGNVPYTARLTTQPEDAQRIRTIWLRAAVQLFVLFLGVLVVLKRPSPATWGFLATVFVGCASINVVYSVGPQWWRILAENLYWTIGNNVVGDFGAIIFALYLLHPGPLPRWRRIVQSVTVALAAVTLIVSVYHANALMFAKSPDGAAWITYSILSTLPLLVAPFVLIATFFESPPNVRERLRWIIGGFLLSAVFNSIDQAGSQGNLGLFDESYVLHSLLIAGMYLAIALPVAYAVLKHHIIDVSVAVSRATVYTTLSVLIVGAFALVDLFFTRALDQKSAGLIADVGLALLLGFSFNSMHRHVDLFVDRMLFRKRHLAEQHIARVADAMTCAHSEQHVKVMLLSEPVRAFELTGAQILTGGNGAPEQLETLMSFLEARRTALRVTDGQWNLQPLVMNEFAPAVAVPLLSHGTVDAAVLYGLHTNGTDLDAGEVTLLEQLCSNAGAALDRLEAETLRREIATLRGGLTHA